MSLTKSAVLLGAFALAPHVNAHGYVSGIIAGGTYYGGYLVDKYPYTQNPPDTVGWSTTAKDLGFVAPDAFSSPDIICHENAEPGAISAKVAAGDTIELQWTEWPESHHGPVIDYLANCNGDCSAVDKTALRFFKIDEAGVLDGSSPPGNWASDELIANNNSWATTIPESIAPGNYVLRHEIIALHSAGNQNGAQNYPQCINLEITGSGTENPEGVPGTELYTATDDGILFNIYQPVDSYPIPGPQVFSAGSGGSGGSPQPSASSPSSPTTSSTSQPASENPDPTTPPTDGGSPSPSDPPAQEPTTTSTPASSAQVPEQTKPPVESSAPSPTNPSDCPSAPTAGTPPGPIKAVPSQGSGPGSGSGSGATPELPIDLPEDLTPQELLFIAREIVDRLLSNQVQLHIAEN